MASSVFEDVMDGIVTEAADTVNYQLHNLSIELAVPLLLGDADSPTARSMRTVWAGKSISSR